MLKEKEERASTLKEAREQGERSKIIVADGGEDNNEMIKNGDQQEEEKIDERDGQELLQMDDQAHSLEQTEQLVLYLS